MEDLDLKQLDQAFRQQIHHCQELLKAEKSQDETIWKALRASRAAVSLLERYTGSDDESSSSNSSDLRLALHSYTHSVLDSTYFQECKITGREFRGADTGCQISSIERALARPSRLCGSPDKAWTVFGPEVLECVYWRIGALLYMYCHTLYEGGASGWREDLEKEKFLECCCAGVGYLRLMLSARTTLKGDDDFVSNDQDTVKLLQQGVFSDLHMLSLMYAGEMCYWAWHITSGKSPLCPSSSPTPTHPQARDPGTKSTGMGKRTKNGTFKESSKDSHATGRGAGQQLGGCGAGVEEDRTGCADGGSPEEENDLVGHCGNIPSDQEKVEEEVLRGMENLRCEVAPPPQDVVGDVGVENSEAASSDSGTWASVSEVSSKTEPANEKGSPGASGVSVATPADSDGCMSSLPCGAVVMPTDHHDNKESSEAATADLFNVMLHTKGPSRVASWRAEFNAVRMGTEMLSKYINVARGPLKQHGWSYSKAVDLIIKLKKCSGQKN